MKKKFITSILPALVLAASLNLNVQAATIPSKAQPGTNIKFDANNKIVVQNGSLTTAESDISLPESQPGMTVSYDGTGAPSHIKINGIPYGSNGYSPLASNASASTVNAAKHKKTGSGAISYYTDKIGQRDHKLQAYDCATDLTNDNCACGTKVYVKDTKTGKSATFKKWDVGNLSKQREKRIIDVWSLNVFAKVFFNGDTKKANNAGLVHSGYYYHD